jgi:uncharacterized protein
LVRFSVACDEELYFRGYLLPRLYRFGIWAPLINISLFSLYHYWTPWGVLSRIVMLLPMGLRTQSGARA